MTSRDATGRRPELPAITSGACPQLHPDQSVRIGSVNASILIVASAEDARWPDLTGAADAGGAVT